MPMTRFANSAIDKVTPQFAEVAEMLAAYGETDLLCHRADTPAELVARQAAIWDPALDWAADHLGARLIPTIGVMHRDQDPAALSRLRDLTHAFDAYELAAFHDLVSLSGSLVLGFAVVHGFGTAEAIWNASRLDETWQEEQWGVDDEAAAHAAVKRQAFLDAARVVALLGTAEAGPPLPA
jgi:chaperone required for assembly of F1-ATPase